MFQIMRIALRAAGFPCAADVNPKIVEENIEHPFQNWILFPIDKSKDSAKVAFAGKKK